MIERYFLAGVRYLWKKPDDAAGVLDGLVVRSTRNPTNLTYDGLHSKPEAINPLLLPNTAMLGLRMGENVPYDWLDYAPGRTAGKMLGAKDILTGYMSGCLIIRGTTEGAINVFHVGTVDGQVSANARVKLTLEQRLPANATGFNPLTAWPPPDIGNCQLKLKCQANSKIFGLVTTAGVFYAILLFNVMEKSQWQNPAGLSYWCVGGIKQVQAMDRNSLLTSLGNT